MTADKGNGVFKHPPESKTLRQFRKQKKYDWNTCRSQLMQNEGQGILACWKEIMRSRPVKGGPVSV